MPCPHWSADCSGYLSARRRILKHMPLLLRVNKLNVLRTLALLVTLLVIVTTHIRCRRPARGRVSLSERAKKLAAKPNLTLSRKNKGVGGVVLKKFLRLLRTCAERHLSRLRRSTSVACEKLLKFGRGC